MAQLFGPRANTIFRLSIVGAVAGLLAALAAMILLPRSPWVTGKNRFVKQDIPFSHEHHVGEIGIDCRFCHRTVEKSSFAGIPPSQTCMKCHRVLFRDAPMLAPVRESFRTGKPLRWNRVYKLPDFVYFDHSIHVGRGVDCRACHGELGRMPWVRRVDAFFMNRCLGCHREKVAQGAGGKVPAKQVGKGLMDCSTCHR